MNPTQRKTRLKKALSVVNLNSTSFNNGCCITFVYWFCPLPFLQSNLSWNSNAGRFTLRQEKSRLSTLLKFVLDKGKWTNVSCTHALYGCLITRFKLVCVSVTWCPLMHLAVHLVLFRLGSVSTFCQGGTLWRVHDGLGISLYRCIFQPPFDAFSIFNLFCSFGRW